MSQLVGTGTQRIKDTRKGVRKYSNFSEKGFENFYNAGATGNF